MMEVLQFIKEWKIMKLKKILRIVIIVCLILIIIDQTSKILINNLVSKDIIIIPNIFSITKLENKGMAFGINKKNIGNIGISLIVLFVIFNYIIVQRSRMKSKTVVFLSFIVSGGISNIIDRIFKGAVFDFIKIGDFPVFNFADMFIVIGWILFSINFLKETAIDIKAGDLVEKDK